MNDLQHIISLPARRHHASNIRCASRGFSITELIVVIGIIALLAGLLLAALRTVRATALSTTTASTMQSFSQACDAFFTDHGFYPGILPEEVLATETVQDSGGNQIAFTTTQNALLHLMGGYRVLQPGQINNNPMHPAQVDYNAFRAANPGSIELAVGGGGSQWRVAIALNRIGEGPVINGKVYVPYFTPGPREVAVAKGKIEDGGLGIPDLLDAWGQPIIYLRQARTTGPLVGAPADRPQYYLANNGNWGALRGYMESTGLGELGFNQNISILNQNTGNDRIHTLAQIIRHPAFGLAAANSANLPDFRARGAYVLISAGKDGIFFSQDDGPGSRQNPVTNIRTGANGNPTIVREYDDVLIFGGG